MTITFNKGREKDTLTCTRADGTTTWMTTSAFFTLHDMAHYAVERLLGFKHGFYGLLNSGMNIMDFEDKLKFRPRELPPETIHTEMIVNLLLTEVSDRTEIKDFQKNLDAACRNAGVPGIPITSQQVNQLRKDLRHLIAKWRTLAPGESLQLDFQ